MLLNPVPPPYDPLEWERKPWPEKARMVCTAWAMQGYGSPLGAYALYAFKVVLYIGGWVFFCRFTPGMGALHDIASWWLRPEAFQKAILWSMLFEGLGLGCGSGPLTGRYFPPFGGALYFLRPGTTKLPVLEGVPLVGGNRRTPLDVLLYLAIAALLVVALVSARPGRAVLVAIALLVPVLGILDKTIFLALRGEHYWTTITLFALVSNWIPGAKAVQAALWFWAGFSKLNHHFPGVVGVMTSNSPILRLKWLRRRMYRGYPDDLSPSRLSVLMSYAGTALELSVPILLLSGRGGVVTIVGLVLMLMLHGYVTSNVPMGVPIEWNLMVVYGAFFLFWKHADASLTEISLPIAIFLAIMLIGFPLLGNLSPSRIPFLMAMRYYAGNWAYSIWLFKGDTYRRLDRLTKTSPWIYDQLERFYPRSVAVALIGKVMAFRLMHLHGRALAQLLPKAVDRVEDYEWIDGELVAGMVLGWNFGEGHLHREQLLRSVQKQCHFESGELRCIMVESQPLGRSTLHYRILDAKDGLIEEGQADIRLLRTQQPWGPAAAQPPT
jgi:Transmembrane protein of unknown function (DUF3556)